MSTTKRLGHRGRRGVLSNYCGIGGSGPIQSIIDALCQDHDNDYGKIIHVFGYHAAYGEFNWADRKFLQRIADIDWEYADQEQKIVKDIAKAFFLFKKDNFPENTLEENPRYNGPAQRRLVNQIQTNLDKTIMDKEEGSATPENTKKQRTTPTISPTKEMVKRKTVGMDPRWPANIEDEDVDMGEEPSNALALRESSMGGNNKIKETPITRAISTYALPNTHTTIIPLDIWFSVAKDDYVTNTSVEVRMTSPYDPVVTTFGTIPTPLTNGVFNQRLLNSDTTAPAIGAFPVQITGGGATESGWWRKYFDKFYQKYTVLSCEWELNGSGLNNPGTGLLVGTFVPGNDGFATNANLMHVRAWAGQNGMEFKKFPSLYNAADYESGTKWKGVYKPGDFKQQVKDDALVETWHNVGSTPSMNENRVFLFFGDPLGTWAPGTEKPGGNFCLSLKWIVQYKDLIQGFRQPTGGAGLSMPAEGDIVPDYTQ